MLQNFGHMTNKFIFFSGVTTSTQVASNIQGQDISLTQHDVSDSDLSAGELEKVFDNLEKKCDNFSGFDSPRRIMLMSTRGSAPPSNLVSYTDSEEDSDDEEGQSEGTKAFRFRDPVAPETLEKLTEKTFAPSTERKITWAVNLFKDWRFLHIREPGSDGCLRWCDIGDGWIQPSNLAYCLCKFLTEVRRADGSEFLTRTLYSIVIMFQMHFDKLGKV